MMRRPRSVSRRLMEVAVPGAFSPEQIEAAAAVVAAGAAFGIPLILVWLGEASRRRELRVSEAAEMREFSNQWQQYNLAVASSDTVAAAVQETGFHLLENGAPRALTTQEKQALHVIFFKLTAMYQAYYGMQRGAIQQDWPQTIIGDLAPTVLENEALLQIALNKRGYGRDFVEYIRAARSRGTLPPITKPAGRRWYTYPGPKAIVALAVIDLLVTIAGVAAALAWSPPTGASAEAPSRPGLSLPAANAPPPKAIPDETRSKEASALPPSGAPANEAMSVTNSSTPPMR